MVPDPTDQQRELAGCRAKHFSSKLLFLLITHAPRAALTPRDTTVRVHDSAPARVHSSDHSPLPFASRKASAPSPLAASSKLDFRDGRRFAPSPSRAPPHAGRRPRRQGGFGSRGPQLREERRDVRRLPRGRHHRHAVQHRRARRSSDPAATHVGRPYDKKRRAIVASDDESVTPIVRYLQHKLGVIFAVLEFRAHDTRGILDIDTSVNWLIQDLAA